MTTDVEALSRLSDDEITTRVTEVFTRAQDRIGWSGMLGTPEDRALVYQTMDPSEVADLKALSEADQRKHQRGEDARIKDEVGQRSRQLGQAIDEAKGRGPRRAGHTPLMVSELHLRSHANAIRNGSVFGAEEELGELEHRANVTVATDMGSPGAWGSGDLRPPVTLREFAGIPNTPLTGATAQMPSVTLPVAAAGVTEAALAPEFDTIDVANLAALRYGRWTQVTSFVDAFDELTIINRAHGVGIARDLNLADITAIQTAAGTVTAFDAANLDRNVRIAIMKVAAATLVDPQDVVVLAGKKAAAPPQPPQGPLCTVPGCDRPVLHRGLCAEHWGNPQR